LEYPQLTAGSHSEPTFRALGTVSAILAMWGLCVALVLLPVRCTDFSS